MAILITSNAYFPNIGGVENSLLYLAKSYVKLGYDVDIVVSDVNLVNDDVLPEFEEVDGIKIHRYASYQSAPKYLKPFCFFKRQLNAVCLLYKLKRISRPQLTISRFHTNAILAKVAGLKNVAYLVPGEVSKQNSNDNMSSQKKDSWKSAVSFCLELKLQKLALIWVDKLFVFSISMKKQVYDSVGKSALVVKPGVDYERFIPITQLEKKQLRVRLNLPTDKKLLLIVGRFVLAKGIQFALEALKNLPNYHLVIVGSGDEEHQYKDYLAKKNLASNVSFTGVRFDTEHYYAASDAFLMTSIYEPFGQTILEAMAAGLPVIAFSEKAGVETATGEILSDSEAIFVAKLSGEALAQAILMLFKDDARVLELSVQSRVVACDLFSWDKLAIDLLES